MPLPGRSLAPPPAPRMSPSPARQSRQRPPPGPLQSLCLRFSLGGSPWHAPPPILCLRLSFRAFWAQELELAPLQGHRHREGQGGTGSEGMGGVSLVLSVLRRAPAGPGPAALLCAGRALGWRPVPLATCPSCPGRCPRSARRCLHPPVPRCCPRLSKGSAPQFPETKHPAFNSHGLGLGAARARGPQTSVPSTPSPTRSLCTSGSAPPPCVLEHRGPASSRALEWQVLGCGGRGLAAVRSGAAGAALPWGPGHHPGVAAGIALCSLEGPTCPEHAPKPVRG